MGEKAGRHVKKYGTKRIGIRVLAFTMGLQLCAPFISFARVSYGGYGERESMLTNVNCTYDDGTSYTKEYDYDAWGNVISEKTKRPDGSKSTVSRTFNGVVLVSESTYKYDAESKIEETSTVRYDESEEIIYSKAYEYDPAIQEKMTRETRREGEGESQSLYTLTTMDLGARGIWKEEVWSSAYGREPVKRIRTNRDGISSTENFTYDAEGNEILYVKTNRDGTTERRETTYTQTGEEIIVTDGRGNTTHRSSDYDLKTELTTEEETENHGDGSSRYTKTVKDNSEQMVSYVCKEKSADGLETDTEKSYRPDGSYTTKEKASDGVITVTVKDTADEIISQRKTLPGGITGETTWTKREDGQVVTEVIRYSDGTEDRIDYEYDESGAEVGFFESRRNGVSAVTVIQYTDEEKTRGNTNITFNNGYEMQYTHYLKEGGEERISFTYSMGDVYQDIIYGENVPDFNMKTVYRDGTTEDLSLWLNIEEEYDYSFTISDRFMNRFERFMEQAWMTLPPQVQTP